MKLIPHISIFLFLQCCITFNIYAQTTEKQGKKTYDAGVILDLDTIEVIDYQIPVLQLDKTSTVHTIITHNIPFLPTLKASFISQKNIEKVYQRDVYVKCGRGQTNFYIDGIRVRSFLILPEKIPWKLVPPSTGVPAKYSCREEYETAEGR